ncbi:MAG: hypothetical protein KBA13_11620 [Chitinophagales bacterium]|nr:hypothetical protein [Bacteroidota bacterium]MBP7257725.1 hypothetical protein [Chitinophagales bacterium]
MNLNLAMNNYYYLVRSSDRKIVGEYTQMVAYDDDETYNLLKSEYRILKKNSFQSVPIDRINIPIKVGEESFLTDFISSGFIGITNAIFTDRVVQLLKNFNTLNTQIVNIKILYKNLIYDNYKIVHFTESLLPKVNFDKSEFYNSMTLDPILIKNYDDFITKRNDLVKKYEQPFLQKIIIDKKHIEGLDYFTIGDSSFDLIVSERLKQALISNKITGVDFKEITDIIFE